VTGKEVDGDCDFANIALEGQERTRGVEAEVGEVKKKRRIGTFLVELRRRRRGRTNELEGRKFAAKRAEFNVF